MYTTTPSKIQDSLLSFFLFPRAVSSAGKDSFSAGKDSFSAGKDSFSASLSMGSALVGKLVQAILANQQATRRTLFKLKKQASRPRLYFRHVHVYVH